MTQDPSAAPVVDTPTGAWRTGHPADGDDAARRAALWQRIRAGEFGRPPAETPAEVAADAMPGAETAPAATAEEAAYPLPMQVAALVPADDPVLLEYQAQARALGLSQAQWDALAGKFVADALAGQRTAMLRGASAPAAADEATALAKAEMRALGADGPAVLQALATWRDELRTRGVIASDAELREFDWFSGSATGVRLLTKIMGLAKVARV